MKLNHTKIIYSTLFGSVFLLTACGGGSSGTANNTPPFVTNLVATAVQAAAPLAICPTGGITMNAGIDSNGNKILDPSEVTSTQYVCNGTNGAAGLNGSSGLTTLVLLTNEVAGPNCASGGKKVSAGQDTNNNKLLDAAEITSTAYVCNGATGAKGASGIPGTNGNNGLNSLIAIVTEPAGTFCTYGGKKVSSGLDKNANGILDALEISASNYVCNGAPGAPGTPGAGVTWVNVTASSVQAVSNKGYLANSAVQVTVTLPASAVLGDVVSVTGIGAGGWKVAQNAGQSIITQPAATTTGAVWTPRTIGLPVVSGVPASGNISGIASSADGNKLVAVDAGVTAAGGLIYTSGDAGVTWLAHGLPHNWSSVASSTDGSKLVAVEFGATATGGLIYTSSDSGVTWLARGLPRLWSSVASSADGSKLVAAAASLGGQIYTSSDSGVTWLAHSLPGLFSVASSADGSKLVATGPSGASTSSDSGVTWVARNSPTWFSSSVASSADGSKLVQVAMAGSIYTSNDFGVTWIPRSSPSIWVAVASSADGSKLVAASRNLLGSSANSQTGGQIYTSSDFGVTWIPRGLPSFWSAVASSADGSKLAAADSVVVTPLISTVSTLYTSVPSIGSTLSTTPGITGSLSGLQYESVDLQCINPNTFVVRAYVGLLGVQ